jgi:hypothetical protein
MDFLNHREGGYDFHPFSCTVYTSFTVGIRKGLREFEETHKRLREFEGKL